MAYEHMDDIGATALAIFNQAIIQTDAYIKDHQVAFSKLNKTKEILRREKLKEYLDFASSTIEQICDDLFQDFDDQITLGNIMGYIDDFYEELRLMTSEQFELFWGFHNPETSETFWGNVESALNLGK
jgi:hypothetical protein